MIGEYEDIGEYDNLKIIAINILYFVKVVQVLVLIFIEISRLDPIIYIGISHIFYPCRYLYILTIQKLLIIQIMI